MQSLSLRIIFSSEENTNIYQGEDLALLKINKAKAKKKKKKKKRAANHVSQVKYWPKWPGFYPKSFAFFALPAPGRWTLSDEEHSSASPFWGQKIGVCC